MKILFTLLTFGTRAANQKHKQAKSNNKQPAYNKKRLKGNIQMTLSIYLSIYLHAKERSAKRDGAERTAGINSSKYSSHFCERQGRYVSVAHAL